MISIWTRLRSRVAATTGETEGNEDIAGIKTTQIGRKTTTGPPFRGVARRLRFFHARSLRAGAALALLSILVGAPATASAAATPNVLPIVVPGSNFLMVSDSVAKKVYFYKAPEMRLTGQLDNVDLRAVHGGVITLPEVFFPSLPGGFPFPLLGGRVIMDDIVNQQILVVHLNIAGAVTHVDHVPANLGDEVPWTAVDPTFRYYAAGSAHSNGDPHNTINLIDLATRKNTQIPVTLNLTEDPHPFLVGNPLNTTLFVSLGNHIDGYKVADVLKGKLTPSSTFPNDSGLHHGNFISPTTKTLGLTSPNGLEVFDFACGFSCALTHETTVPYKVSGFTDDLRSFRPRVTADGTRVVGSIQPSPLGTMWATQPFDVHVADLTTKTATRLNVGKGVPGTRGYGLSRTLAAFTILRPATNGDLVRLLDVNSTSPTYLHFVGDVTLPHLTNGPVQGVDPTGTQGRSVAISPDGKFAFVTSGGEGKISIINTTTLTVRTTTVPTALDTSYISGRHP